MEDNLEILRELIDKTDEKLLDAYAERVSLVERVGQYKRKNNLPLENINREEEVYKKLTQKFGEQFAEDIRLLYFTIMTLSKTRQNRILSKADSSQKQIYCYTKLDAKCFNQATAACQGAEGANSHTAAKSLGFDKTLFYASFCEVFDAVSKGEADFGVLPIENSTAGSVFEIYDLLHKHNLFVVRAIKQRISHCLMAAHGVKIEDIKSVYSHPHALNQCSNFIEQHCMQPLQWQNTALAAKKIALEKPATAAAICSLENAELYELDILASDIQNERENYTRFIVVGRENMLSDDADKISLSLVLEHKPYSLCRLLNLIAAEGLNIQKIESRPIPDKKFEFTFYLDLDGNILSPRVKSFFENISQYCTTVRFLGCYNEN